MPDPTPPRWAILYPGDRAVRDRSDPAQSRFATLFSALADAGVAVEPAVYNDDFSAEVEEQLQRVQGVLVWHNPIEGGRTRQVLDDMLRPVAHRGVRVSAHPDTILCMGTKDVLIAVRDLPFGSDAHRVGSLEQLAAELPTRLAEGMTRACLVGDQVAGVGHQAVNTLVPAAKPGGAPPAPGPRPYSSADDPRCEINVSSVSPFPDSAIPALVAAVLAHHAVA